MIFGDPHGISCSNICNLPSSIKGMGGKKLYANELSALPWLPGRTFTPCDPSCQDHTRSQHVKLLVQNFPPSSLSLVCTLQTGLWWGEDHLCGTQQTQEWFGLPNDSPDNQWRLIVWPRWGCTQERLSVVFTFFQCQCLEHGHLSDGAYLGKVIRLGWVECYHVYTVWKPIVMMHGSSSLFIKQTTAFC